MTAVFGMLTVLVLGLAAWFGVRYLLLKRALRQADRELREIAEHLEDNRIAKLASPTRTWRRCWAP
ncbi:MAG: hypothetical protein ACLSVD_18615 [Eggerthellaceae bacterium]